MEINAETLKELYAKWTTEDLIKALSIDRENYEPMAIEVMEMEARKRNVKDEEIYDFQKNYLKEEKDLKATGKLYCPHCHSLQIREGRRPWYLLVMPVVFYFLLPKYECLECGRTFKK